MAQNGLNGLMAGLAGQFQMNPAFALQQQQLQLAQQVMQQAVNDPNSLQQLLMFDPFAQFQQQQFAPHPPVQAPIYTTPRKISPSNSDSGLDLKFLDDAYNSQHFKTPSKLDPNTKSLCELQNIAIAGCAKASQIYQIHSKRPYFKKIDLLCDRLKQDLSNTDKAVVNINSHGVAWAIKDFIFVFNRIMNAWVIIRDYFYSASEGMQCVKEGLDPNFASDFIQWQEATAKLSKSLIASFESLNLRDQRNGNRRTTKFTPERSPAYDPFQKLFDPVIAENSEKVQLSGGYMKSAVYKPVASISATSSGSSEPSTPLDISTESFKLLMNDVIPEVKKQSPNPLYARGSPAPPNVFKTPYRMSKANLSATFDALDLNDDGITPLPDLDEVENLPMASMFKIPKLQQQYGTEAAKKIVHIFNDIMTKPEAISFVDPKAEGNSFHKVPNFIQGEDTASLTSIIANIDNGKYKTVQDVFIALKMMAEYAKALLQFNQHENDFEKDKIICEFVDTVETSLARHA